MKKLYVFLIALLILAVNARDVFTNSAQPPLGRTGAPGESSCAATGCHPGSASPAGSNATFLIGDQGTTPTTPITSSFEYEAGKAYSILLEINETSTRHGFELTALDDANVNAGTFAAQQTITTGLNTSGGRTYMHHKSASGATSNWTFDWTAPSSGNVTFYCMMNAAKSPVGTAGDNIYSWTETISLKQTTAIPEFDVDAIGIYPNPVQDHFYMDLPASGQELLIELYDLNGKLVMQLHDGPVNDQNIFSDVSSIDRSGVYILSINRSLSKKIVIL